MTAERHIITFGMDWQGIALSVTFEPDWLKLGESGATVLLSAHLTVTAIAPERARLPITETGYRSHFVPCGAVVAAGGPEAYVRAWLDQAARSPDWRCHQSQSRQLDLFGHG